MSSFPADTSAASARVAARSSGWTRSRYGRDSSSASVYPRTRCHAGLTRLTYAVEPGDQNMSSDSVKKRSRSSCARGPIDEHANLVADRRQHRQQVRVGGADVAAEELHDAEYFAAEQDRKPEGRVESFARGDRGARKVRVVDDVGNPGRFGAGPDAARKAGAAGKRQGAAGGVELGKAHQRRGPDPGTAQGVSFAVDRPQRTVFPSERLADGLEDLRGRVVYGGGIEEGACRDCTRR